MSEQEKARAQELLNESIRRDTAYKLKDSFSALAKEYRVSERWREHFYTLINEVSKVCHDTD